MFTGIIEKTGAVADLRSGKKGGLQLGIRCGFSGARMGESIAVNGVCLTVMAKKAGALWFEVSAETLHRSALGDLRKGETVNLERSLRLSDRLGGHIVQGHVDATGTLLEKKPQEGGKWYEFSYPASLRPYLVEKGSIAVDGVSLTIARLQADRFSIAVVPYTEAHTSFGKKPVGARVNLEADLVAKIVAKQFEVWKKR